jgi:ketosteroid isomerase-like protein
MKKFGWLVFCLLLTAPAVIAQTAPDAAELTKLLNDFLAGASRNDAAVHERFWADDLIYTRSAGRRVNKEEVMHDVRSTPAAKPDDPTTVFTAEDIRIQQYGNTAIVAFRLVATTTEAGGDKHVQNLLNSGTFVKRNGKWQVVNWQATRMPRSEAENKMDVAAVAAAFRQALINADAKKLSALTDPTFILTNSGKQMTRQQLLENSGSAQSKVLKAESPETIAVYGETAVVRGGPNYTMTLINQAGVWRLVALHVTE